ncbi:MAG: class I SAM-dependent methyltransferase [Actinobacteria bacterium]|nr:class I SAM-dependent methyltransferase [Actinomycetota bacterium]
MKQRLRRIARRAGFDLVRHPPPDLSHELLDVARLVRPYTMTSIERINALYEATRYVVRNRVAGAIVECGVWRGGGMMVVARALLDAGEPDRELFLFDTFAGMVEPGPLDRRTDDTPAGEVLDSDQEYWCVSTIDEVRQALSKVAYPPDRIELVAGKVEETVPARAPERIALLRLDTDWYESTRHELVHLFPRISPGGVLIVDDYGYWKGARQAVDEYVRENDLPLLLHRIDDCARVAVVPARPVQPGDG